MGEDWDARDVYGLCFFSQGPNIDEIIPACSYIVGSMENKQ